jgi:hypothetical protein
LLSVAAIIIDVIIFTGNATIGFVVFLSNAIAIVSIAIFLLVVVLVVAIAIVGATAVVEAFVKCNCWWMRDEILLNFV